MKTLYLAALATLTAGIAHAQIITPKPPSPSVPEIDALAGIAAIAAVGAVVALIRERSKH